MKKMFIAVGPHGWGKADYAQGAVKRCRSNQSRKLKKPEEYDVFEVDVNAFVDYMGNLKCSDPPVRVAGRGQFMLLQGETEPQKG